MKNEREKTLGILRELDQQYWRYILQDVALNVSEFTTLPNAIDVGDRVRIFSVADEREPVQILQMN